MTDSARILVVDNYDSFVYTIVGYLKTLGAAVTVVRNDAIDPGEADVIDEYDGVLISPGPGAPADSGASEGMIRLCAEQSKPMFGVCLGMQALAEVFGATVSHAPTIMHGKTSLVEHIDDEIFEGVANPMTATRYHSLAVEPDSVPEELVVTAWTQVDHIVQGIKHCSKPMYAVQFHPESVMTQDGYRLLANWLKVCGQENAVERSKGLQPKVAAEGRSKKAWEVRIRMVQAMVQAWKRKSRNLNRKKMQNRKKTRIAKEHKTVMRKAQLAFQLGLPCE